MSQCTISCELHVACLYGYRVKLILKDHSLIDGKILDLLTSAEKREYLIIDNGLEQRQIESNQLRKMQVLTANALFKEREFI